MPGRERLAGCSPPLLPREADRKQGGFAGKLKRLGLGAAAVAGFVRLYLIPAKRNDLPQQVRLAPAW